MSECFMFVDFYAVKLLVGKLMATYDLLLPILKDNSFRDWVFHSPCRDHSSIFLRIWALFIRALEVHWLPGLVCLVQVRVIRATNFLTSS